MQRPLLIISRHPPGHPSAPSNALHAALATATLDLPVSLLWLGDGVLQLFPDAPETRTDLQRSLCQLALFDTIQLACDAHALLRHGLAARNAVLPVSPLSPAALQALVAQHRHVVNY